MKKSLTEVITENDFLKQAVNNACFTKLRELPEFDELIQSISQPA